MAEEDLFDDYDQEEERVDPIEAEKRRIWELNRTLAETMQQFKDRDTYPEVLPNGDQLDIGMVFNNDSVSLYNWGESGFGVFSNNTPILGIGGGAVLFSGGSQVQDNNLTLGILLDHQANREAEEHREELGEEFFKRLGLTTEYYFKDSGTIEKQVAVDKRFQDPRPPSQKPLGSERQIYYVESGLASRT